MDIRFEKSGEDWTAAVEIQGRTVRLLIDRIHPSSEHQRLARQAISRVEESWPTIGENLVRSLHSLYNKVWAEPDDGFPTLDAEAFLACIVLQTVWVMDEPDAMSLIFDDSGLFGGHGIDVSCGQDGVLHDATLFG